MFKTMVVCFGCAVAAVAIAGGYSASNSSSSSSDTENGAGDIEAAQGLYYKDGQGRSSLGKDAYAQIANADYTNAITIFDDQVTVFFEEEMERCYILAQGSNSNEDWWNNLDTGTEGIMYVLVCAARYLSTKP